MYMSTLVVALITAMIVWWFLVRRLTAKPWTGVDELDDIGPLRQPAKRVALWVLFCCISSLFALFMTAYLMRANPHHAADWYPITVPGILWLNTGLLILGSIAMQWARHGEQQGNLRQVKLGLLAGGGLTAAFLIGQLIGWLQLHASTYYDMVNPAVGFFYLLTAVHGLHLLGGLYVWGRTTLRMLPRVEIERDSLSIELCTTYWHYLLLVWFILFALLLSK